MTNPPPNVLELPILERATLALCAAVEGVIEEAARDGRSLCVWRGGQPTMVPGVELLEELRLEQIKAIR